MPAAFLPDRAQIRVSGTDAEHFLQNLITTDLDALAAGEAAPGALLTPQGKLLFDFLISRDGDGFLLETAESQVEGLIKRLTLYRLRAKVEMTKTEAIGMTVCWGEEPPEGAVRDLRFEAAGIVVGRWAGRDGEHPLEGYDALRILSGVVEQGRDFALEDAFPHDVSFDKNRGVSFKKGCYIGQEVVSRMQHRGTARRRVVCVAGEDALPPTGTVLTAGGKPIGALGTVAGNRALAIVRIDRAGEAIAENAPILAGEQAVTLSLPAWTGLSFPTKAEEA